MKKIPLVDLKSQYKKIKVEVDGAIKNMLSSTHFIASSSTISLAGAKPVLVDCDENSFNIDSDKIEAKITKKTKTS